MNFLAAGPPVLPSSGELLPMTFWTGLLGSIVFGLVGIALVVLGFKVFDWVTPHIDVERELAQKNNLSVAIVTAAVILGVCYIVGQVVR